VKSLNKNVRRHQVKNSIWCM